MSLGDRIIRFCDLGFGGIEVVRRWFGRPSVKTISTTELQSLIDANEVPFVLIDVRSAAEQDVSRIPGAISRRDFESGGGKRLNEPIIVYCTVGGRSYLYARQLVAAGVDAKNYRDGILGWCRAGLPLESPDKQATNAVHPYWRIFHVPDQYIVKTVSAISVAAEASVPGGEASSDRENAAN